MTGWTVPCTFVDAQGGTQERVAIVVLGDSERPDSRFHLDVRFEGASRGVLVELEDLAQLYSAISSRVWQVKEKEQQAQNAAAEGAGSDD